MKPTTPQTIAWWDEAKPHLDLVGSAEQRFVDAFSRGAETAGVAAMDELLVVSADGSRWIKEHPCPDREVGQAFTGMMNNYTSMARSVIDAFGGNLREEEAQRRVDLAKAQIHEFAARLSDWKA